MKISYILGEETHKYQSHLSTVEENKLSGLLTNAKGDFFHIQTQTCSKHMGLFMSNPKTLEMFKIIDSLTLENVELQEVSYNGVEFSRMYSSEFVEGEEIKDSFFLSPNGGFIYEVSNYSGNLQVDLDMRKQFDFDKWGKDYTLSKEDGILLVEYEKRGKDSYKVYLGIKASNFSYDLLEKWTQKSYLYDEAREQSQEEHFIYSLLKTQISGSKKILFGYGLSIEEVKTQIKLLEAYESGISSYENEDTNAHLLLEDFSKPLSQDVNVAYRLSKHAMYQFMNTSLELETTQNAMFAGYPWFSKLWTRDELVSLRSFIEMGEYKLVKERLLFFLSLVDEETAETKRILESDSLTSLDTTFWIFKRLLDLIFELDREQQLEEYFSKTELSHFFEKGRHFFNTILEKDLDSQMFLLKIKRGDSWMDTIDVDFPLDIQVQFLTFTADMAILAALIGNHELSEKYLDFEDKLRQNIRAKYLREEMLYSETFKDKISTHVFFAYYLYSDLLTPFEWEKVFDKALKHLKMPWGGLTTLSQFDAEFVNTYSGSNDKSYHNGDVWFWQNNITALVLDDFNEHKYKQEIKEILLSSTRDILLSGTLGFSSEVSSAKAQESQGCFAQAW